MLGLVGSFMFMYAIIRKVTAKKQYLITRKNLVLLTKQENNLNFFSLNYLVLQVRQEYFLKQDIDFLMCYPSFLCLHQENNVYREAGRSNVYGKKATYYLV